MELILLLVVMALYTLGLREEFRYEDTGVILIYVAVMAALFAMGVLSYLGKHRELLAAHLLLAVCSAYLLITAYGFRYAVVILAGHLLFAAFGVLVLRDKDGTNPMTANMVKWMPAAMYTLSAVIFLFAESYRLKDEFDMLRYGIAPFSAVFRAEMEPGALVSVFGDLSFSAVFRAILLLRIPDFCFAAAYYRIAVGMLQPRKAAAETASGSAAPGAAEQTVSLPVKEANTPDHGLPASKPITETNTAKYDRPASRPIAGADAPQTGADPDTEAAIINVLRQYKALMDQGVITKEEFDAKKKQLLGL